MMLPSLADRNLNYQRKHRENLVRSGRRLTIREMTDELCSRGARRRAQDKNHDAS